MDFHERDTWRRGFVEGAGSGAVETVGRDEGGDGDGGGVREEFGDFGDAADVFVAVGLGEAEVFVQAETDVVACWGSLLARLLPHPQCRLLC